MAIDNNTSFKFSSYKAVKNAPGMLPIQWHKKTLTHADLTDADGSETEDVSVDDNGAEIPDGSYIIGAGVKLITPFSGGTVSAITVQVGDAGDPDELVTASDIFTGVAAGTWIQTGGAYVPMTRESDYAVAAVFTVTGDNAVNLTAGALQVWVAYVRLSDPTA